MYIKILKSISLLVLVISNSCGKPTSSKLSEQDATKRVLKVLSYNIRHGAPENSSMISMDNIASVIKMQNPDIVLLQEVDKNTTRAGENQAEALGNRLKMFSYFSKSIDYNKGEYGVAILSKYKIIKSESILLPNNTQGGEQRSIALITVEIPNLGEVVFGSTHLDLKVENRVEQITVLNNLANTLGKPLIIGGDFNATPESADITSFKTSFTIGCSGSNCSNTFPASKPVKVIDYIGLNSIAAEKLVLRSYLTITDRLESDHLPLLGVYTY